jgi:putative NADH-flavin reductase
MEGTMKITIFGATGGVGRLALEQAIAAGHDVTAVVRNPDLLPADTRHVKADLTVADPAAVESAVAGADGVLSALGPRSKADAGIVTQGTKLIVAAMKATDVRRLIVISAYPVGTVPSPARPNPPKHDPGDGLVMRTVLNPIVKAVFRSTYADLAEMEDVVRASGLDWTIARPPRLVNKAFTGKYRTSFERNLPGGRTISRADLADFMLKALTRPETIGQTVRVTT